MQGKDWVFKSPIHPKKVIIPSFVRTSCQPWRNIYPQVNYVLNTS